MVCVCVGVLVQTVLSPAQFRLFTCVKVTGQTLMTERCLTSMFLKTAFDGGPAANVRQAIDNSI